MRKGYLRAGPMLWLVACVLAMSGPGSASATDAPEWTIDAKNSRITFTGRQMNVPTEGEFKRFSAKVRFDPADLAGSSVDVTIDISSAYTGNKDIDATLESENFFDAKRHPQARFVATTFRAKGDSKFEAVGKLTIRDATQDVVLPFTLDVKEDGGQLVAKVAGKLTVSRTKFGVGRGQWGNTKVIDDNVMIDVSIVAHRKK